MYENDMEDMYENSADLEITESYLKEAIEIIRCGLQITPIPPLARNYIETWLEEWSKTSEDDDYPIDDDVLWGK